MKKQAILLDRDGVINQAVIKDGKPYPPASVAELVIEADVQPSLTALKSAGFLLIVVTNQPDVARGKTTQNAVHAINDHLMEQLPLDDILVCYHDDKDQCACRKPQPGLLLQAAKQYDLDLKQCVMVGDRWRDIEAGQRAGCKTVWINNNYTEKASTLPADFTTTTFGNAAKWILCNDNIILGDLYETK